MASDLISNPEFTSARRGIVDGESLNWLLLSYDIPSDRLSLAASGTGGLLEMKGKIAGSACFGFCRVGLSQGSRFVLVNYISPALSGVSKAHTLVCSRQVSSLFLSQDATITVDNIEDLTIDFVMAAIAEATWSEATSRPPLPRKDAIEKSLPVIPGPAPEREPDLVQKSVPAPSNTESSFRSGVLGAFLRRKKEKHKPHPDLNLSTPAPSQGIARSSLDRLGAIPSTSNRPSKLASDSKLPQTSEPSLHVSDLEPDAVVVDLVPKPRSTVPVLRLNPAPRAVKAPIIVDPVERARIRTEKQRQAYEEEKEALRQQAEYRSRLVKQKEDEIRREEEEATRKKTEMQEKVKQVMAERKRMAQAEKEAESLKSLELEERKRAEKEKRMEHTRRSEERRREKSKLTADLVKKEQQTRQEEIEEKLFRIRLVKASVAGKMKAGSVITGWVTLQTNESLIWKRRYYQVVGSSWALYRSAQDTHTILDQLELRGRVDSFCEWYDGYEDLKAIPHSFAIRFRDGQGSLSAFCDSEDEKYRLLGLLHHISGH